jgi:hypothetical protein
VFSLRILSCVEGSVVNNNGFWIGRLDLLTASFTITSNHNQYLPKTCSILSHSKSVFSSTVTDFLLIYESLNSELQMTAQLTVDSSTNDFRFTNGLFI